MRGNSRILSGLVTILVAAAAGLLAVTPVGAQAAPPAGTTATTTAPTDGTPTVVGEVTVTLEVIGEAPADTLMAFFWACAQDTDFTTFPNTGGTQSFPLIPGDSCVFAVRDEPGVPAELFGATITVSSNSPDLTMAAEPAAVRFEVADGATGSPPLSGAATFTATFADPAPPAPPATPVDVGPAFTG